MKRFFILLVAAISAMVLLTAGNTSAASWPEKGKLITLYVGSGAGGASDMAARMIVQFLEPELGVKFVIINKTPHQAGLTEFILKSGTDGYMMTLFNMPSAHSFYLDPARKAIFSRADFQLVANFAWSPVGIAAKKGRYKTLQELVDKAKANPGKVTIAPSSPLSPGDYGIILLEKAAGVSFGHMFFDQAGEQRAALLGGHVDAEANPSLELISGQKNGEIETLAILDAKENIYFPGIKTAEAQGFKNVIIGHGPGLAFKTGTPKEIVDRVASAVEAIGKKPEYLAMCQKFGLTAEVMTGQKYADAWKHSEGVVQAVLDDMKKVKK